jgi:hypothetical protein
MTDVLLTTNDHASDTKPAHALLEVIMRDADTTKDKYQHFVLGTLNL